MAAVVTVARSERRLEETWERIRAAARATETDADSESLTTDG